jgi:hypothetical protein
LSKGYNFVSPVVTAEMLAEPSMAGVHEGRQFEFLNDEPQQETIPSGSQPFIVSIG